MDTMKIDLVESLSDTLFEIGKGLASQNNFSLASKWLERSNAAINSQGIETLSRESLELRMAIAQALFTAYLKDDKKDSFQKAENLVAQLESEIGDKVLVLLLRLELLLKSPKELFDANAFAGVLKRLIKSTDLSEPIFKMTLHHIHTLNDSNPLLACEALDYFLSFRVIPSQHGDSIEKATIFRTQMATSSVDNLEAVQSLSAILDAVENGTHQPLGASAALALQTVR